MKILFLWKSDRRKVEHLIVNGWDTPVDVLVNGTHAGFY
jgi:hypothetical protein